MVILYRYLGLIILILSNVCSAINEVSEVAVGSNFTTHKLTIGDNANSMMTKLDDHSNHKLTIYFAAALFCAR